MLTILLIIIYLAFISLGLPDAILGSAWPMIHRDLSIPISYAGIPTMIVCGGTIVSSFFSGKVIRRFGTGSVTMCSVFLTAVGLLGIYIAPSFLWICILGIPLGLGAGAVDSALNNFVALHYKAKHMNWLHCFWGIGATTGPFIMSYCLLQKQGWRLGYATIGSIQAFLVICLFASLPLWKKFEQESELENVEKKDVKITTLLHLPGAKPAMVAFFCYCAVELTTGLWASSFLVTKYNVSPQAAAKWVSIYYLGITIGRFLAGFLAIKLNNNQMIRLGQGLCSLGILMFFFQVQNDFQYMGLLLIGLGCAPIYPAMLHETPNRFGKDVSQGIMGIQMAVAYVGSTFVPPLFGMLSKVLGFDLLPYFLFLLMVLMFVMTERVIRVCKTKKNQRFP